MGIGLSEIAKACKELGWKGCLSEAAIKSNVIAIILGEVLSPEQLKKVAENTWSDKIRTVAKLKLSGASNTEIMLVLEARI
jgi:hypothetical protein